MSPRKCFARLSRTLASSTASMLACVYAIKIALVELGETRWIALRGFDEDALVRLVTQGLQPSLQARGLDSLNGDTPEKLRGAVRRTAGETASQERRLFRPTPSCPVASVEPAAC